MVHELKNRESQQYFSLLYELTDIEKEVKMAELLSLKVYPFTANRYYTVSIFSTGIVWEEEFSQSLTVEWREYPGRCVFRADLFEEIYSRLQGCLVRRAFCYA